MILDFSLFECTKTFIHDDRVCSAETSCSTTVIPIFNPIRHFLEAHILKFKFWTVASVPTSCSHARWTRPIDHMHMTSQKGAQLRWGSNETLPRASSPSMQPGGGKPCKPHRRAGPPGPAHWEAWVPMRTASTTRARCATLDWRRCYGDVTLCDVNA